MALLAPCSQSATCLAPAHRTPTACHKASSAATTLALRTPRSALRAGSARKSASAFLGARHGKEHLGHRGEIAALVQGQWAGALAVRRRAASSPSASLFGVGAPEALVIGVVALIVFGPKGLAEVARNLGKTLKTFQPTIRELQEVTREFKDTLQQEIGLDELKNPPPPPRRTPTPIADATTAPAATTAVASTPAAAAPAADSQEAKPTSQAYTADDMARITEEQIRRSLELNTVSEEARKASELAAWKGAPPATATTAAPQTPTPVIEPTKDLSPAPESVKAQSTTAPKADLSPAPESVKAQSTSAPKADA